MISKLLDKFDMNCSHFFTVGVCTRCQLRHVEQCTSRDKL